MAAKKEKTEKIELERVYNIPLRKKFQKAPKHKRAKKAVKAAREFLSKHMKADADNVKLGKHLNLKIWERGIKNPPHHVKVNATKDSEGKVVAEIVGAPIEKKKEEKKTKKPEAVKKEEDKKEEKQVEPETKEAPTEAKVEEVNKEEKEEKKEMPKENVRTPV